VKDLSNNDSKALMYLMMQYLYRRLHFCADTVDDVYNWAIGKHVERSLHVLRKKMV
jgi:hypothetical protein